MVQLNNTFNQLKVSEDGPAVQQRPSRPVKATYRTRTSAEADDLDLQADSIVDSTSSSSTQLLALLSRLFAPLRRSPTFSSTLQHVKGLLYDKQYLVAFGTESEEGERWREVYAARWVPSRAVIYQRIFEECGIAQHLGWGEGSEDGAGRLSSEEEELEHERERARLRRRLRQEGKSADEISRAVAELEEQLRKRMALERGGEGQEVVNAIMIGAGAGSEVVALGAVLGAAAAAASASAQTDDDSMTMERRVKRAPRIRVQAIDQGSWDVLLDKMAHGLRTAWPALDGDAGEGKDSAFDVRFIKGDILDESVAVPSTSTSASPPSAISAIDFASPSLRLITICFTISELLLQSRLKTLQLFSSISHSAPRGTLLLIVESASLAQIPIGKEGRTYPLGRLLDHALCGSGAEADGAGVWEVLKSEDAKWYRMPEDADEVYNAMGKGTKVKLENSRVVLRLYRKR
ncbi:hypothetical protein JCM10908_001122 [Rhodotorula pacifica]|uniref:25S rRNA (uracil2843-N3)-methyltransferase n=1 Tax=Rhodotorula pacifica TaxID=1495444 RepID=UPI003177C792